VELQRDWNALGPDAFAFEMLDRLEPRDEPGYDPRDDLCAGEQPCTGRIRLPMDWRA
jgi:hypothetical protein